MTHSLVQQLRFTRSEFRRGIQGLSEADATRRFLPMNCISWNVGHLAWQEQRNWLSLGGGLCSSATRYERFASGGPASTPSLAEVLGGLARDHGRGGPLARFASGRAALGRRAHRAEGGREVTARCFCGRRTTTGTTRGRTWRSAAARPAGLPEFVGNIDGEAPYRLPSRRKVPDRGP